MLYRMSMNSVVHIQARLNEIHLWGVSAKKKSGTKESKDGGNLA